MYTETDGIAYFVNCKASNLLHCYSFTPAIQSQSHNDCRHPRHSFSYAQQKPQQNHILRQQLKYKVVGNIKQITEDYSPRN